MPNYIAVSFLSLVGNLNSNVFQTYTLPVGISTVCTYTKDTHSSSKIDVCVPYTSITKTAKIMYWLITYKYNYSTSQNLIIFLK